MSTAYLEVPTILDRPEQRFPLDLGVRIPRIRDLLRNATRNQWNPATDVDWDALRPEDFTEEQRLGARYYWSRRAWSEYGAISESPTLQIRYCVGKFAPDMQLYFTLRSQEESRHAEACYRMAEKLGGYLEAPAKTEYQGAVATHGVRRAALDPNASLESTIAALVCAAEEIAFDVFRHLVEITPNPVARQICKLIMRDEVRHCAFGWHFISSRLPHMTPAEIEDMRQAVITMIEKVELNGYHSAWLAPSSPSTEVEMGHDRLAWEAGLGAIVEELEKPIFAASLARIRAEMKNAWGIDIPMFRHHKYDTEI